MTDKKTKRRVLLKAEAVNYYCNKAPAGAIFKIHTFHHCGRWSRTRRGKKDVR